MAQFKRGDFSTCDAPRPGRSKTVTTSEIIDQIHEIILEDRRISAKSIPEKLGISRQRVGSIIHEDLDKRKLSAEWVPKSLKADQKCHRFQSSEQVWKFFGVIQMISCRDWWPWTKHGYITMTRRQNNKQWSGGIAAHPAPKNSECKNPLEKFSPRFFGIKTASSSLIIFQRAKYQRGVLPIFAGAIEGHFEGKTLHEIHQGSLVLARQFHNSQGTCNQEETGLPGLPLSWSPILFSGSGPDGLPPVLWAEKAIEMSPLFKRRRGHCCRGDLGGRTTFWFFFEWLAKVRATGHEVYWASWGVCWINPEFGHCSLFLSWSG